MPIARLGRLAVDSAYLGRQLGATLLWDAAMRAVRSEVAVFALAVDAKDDRAEAFYLHHGFTAFGSSPASSSCHWRISVNRKAASPQQPFHPQAIRYPRADHDERQH